MQTHAVLRACTRACLSSLAMYTYTCMLTEKIILRPRCGRCSTTRMCGRASINSLKNMTPYDPSANLRTRIVNGTTTLVRKRRVEHCTIFSDSWHSRLQEVQVMTSFARSSRF